MLAFDQSDGVIILGLVAAGFGIAVLPRCYSQIVVGDVVHRPRSPSPPGVSYVPRRVKVLAFSGAPFRITPILWQLLYRFDRRDLWLCSAIRPLRPMTHINADSSSIFRSPDLPPSAILQRPLRRDRHVRPRGFQYNLNALVAASSRTSCRDRARRPAPSPAVRRHGPTPRSQRPQAPLPPDHSVEHRAIAFTGAADL